MCSRGPTCIPIVTSPATACAHASLPHRSAPESRRTLQLIGPDAELLAPFHRLSFLEGGPHVNDDPHLPCFSSLLSHSLPTSLNPAL